MDSAASLATTFFTDLPFSGEVNLLTTGAFGPGEMFSGDLLPRGVAYMAIGAPTPAGDWSVRAAMNQGDLSSWIVAGAFQSRGSGADAAHVYRFGYSYSAQDYLGGNPAALVAATDGSRNVGELFALDRWSITPGDRGRVRWPVRPLRLPAARRPLQPEGRRDGRAVQEHARLGDGGAADGRAGRGRVRRERNARTLAAARAHVRAARRAWHARTRSASSARATSIC